MSGDLASARRRFEAALGASQASLERELGTAPRRPVWIGLLVAGAVGLALAFALGRR